MQITRALCAASLLLLFAASPALGAENDSEDERAPDAEQPDEPAPDAEQPDEPAPDATQPDEPAPDAEQPDEPAPAPPAPPAPAPPPAPTSPYYDVNDGTSAPPSETRGYSVPPGPEPEDFALAFPRALLSPLWLITTGIAYPIDGILIGLDAGYVIPRLNRVLRWNDEGTAGWSPALSFSFSDGFSGGVNFFHDNLGGYGESIRYSGRFGGLYLTAHELAFRAERLGGSRLYLEVRGRLEVDANLRFEGIGGPRTRSCDGANEDPRAVTCRTRYAENRGQGVLRLGGTFGRPGKVFRPGVTAVFDHRRSSSVRRGDHLSADTVYDASLIPGFDEPVTVLELTGDFVVDTRDNAGLDPIGFFMELYGGGAVPVAGHAWWRYGLEINGNINLFGGDRVLVLRGLVESVHGDDVPFQHMVVLGGSDRLRGYRTESLRDVRGALLSVEYRWPMHRNLRAFVHTDLGAVGPTYASLVSDSKSLRPSAGGGVLFGAGDSVWLRVGLSYGDSVQFHLSTDLAYAFQQRTRR